MFVMAMAAQFTPNRLHLHHALHVLLSPPVEVHDKSHGALTAVFLGPCPQITRHSIHGPTQGRKGNAGTETDP